MGIRSAMIDMETLSTRLDAVIISVGLVIFDRTDKDYAEIVTFYAPINFDDQMEKRNTQGNTIRWWLRQDDEARDAFLETENAPGLDQVLRDMTSVLFNYQVDEVWSKGANFDIAILEYIAQKKETEFWSYRKPRCFRTVQALFPGHKVPQPGKHNALADAKHQAEELHRITQAHLIY